MSEKFDLTFYYQVKAKFKAKPGTAIFISVTSDDVDELVPRVFTRKEEDYREYRDLIDKHWNNSKPYFIVSRFQTHDYVFFHACKEFRREEDYLTGKIKSFKSYPYKKLEYNIEQLRADLLKLGEMLSPDSKAS